MKRILVMLVASGALLGTAAGTQAGASLAEADALFAKGGLENYARAIDLYRETVTAEPQSFEAAWKCGRAYREYGNSAKKSQVDGWQDICEQYGKTGMRYAARAKELDAERVEGHYYYGLSVGIYSDGVSILTALREGLKGKTQRSFEKAYAIDKTYDDAGPVLSLARFWAVLPWPLHDRDKSLEYFREYQRIGRLDTYAEGQVYFAELLIDLGGDRNAAEARRLLEKARQTEDKYFRQEAERLLRELD